MAKLKKRSAAPIYAIALVWVIFTLVHPLYRVSDYVSVILLSAVAFIVAKGLFPTVEYELPDWAREMSQEADPDPSKETDPDASQKEDSAEDTAEPHPLLREKDRALAELARLDEAIADDTVSAHIRELEATTGKIIDHVMAHPEKQPQIRKFLTYYLPTTLKLLNTYDRMGAAGVSGENIGGTMGKIETAMETIVSAFHRQLDALFQDEAMDIASDITVLENLLAQEGLTD